MEKGFINITKVKYAFQDGNEMSGLEISLAPKVKKFINMSRDNLDLLKIMGNGIWAWYQKADYGDDIVLSTYTGDDPVVPVKVM